MTLVVVKLNSTQPQVLQLCTRNHFWAGVASGPQEAVCQPPILTLTRVALFSSISYSRILGKALLKGFISFIEKGT